MYRLQYWLRIHYHDRLAHRKHVRSWWLQGTYGSMLRYTSGTCASVVSCSVVHCTNSFDQVVAGSSVFRVLSSIHPTFRNIGFGIISWIVFLAEDAEHVLNIVQHCCMMKQLWLNSFKSCKRVMTRLPDHGHTLLGSNRTYTRVGTYARREETLPACGIRATASF